MEAKSVTRQELFDLVWSVPMTHLAARFGISDVALRKKCVKHNVPTPGLGFWAKVQAGQKVKRPRLPEASNPEKPIELRAQHQSGDLAPRPPSVIVPDKLSAPHPAVAFLRDRLEGSRTDGFGRLTGGREWRHCVRPTCLPRLLRLLQGLFEALIERGHEVKVGPRTEHRDPDVEIVILGEELSLAVEERLNRRERILTAKEKERERRSNEWRSRFGGSPRKETRHWVQYPDGDLVFRASAHWEFTGRKTWSDTRHHKLEEQLGKVVLGLEAIAKFQRVVHLEEQRVAAERLAQKRAQLRASRLKEYRAMLADDVLELASDWAKAQALRSFLAECKARLPEEPLAQEWLAAAVKYATELDPFADIASIPKDLFPSDEVLEDLLSPAKGP